MSGIPLCGWEGYHIFWKYLIQWLHAYVSIHITWCKTKRQIYDSTPLFVMSNMYKINRIASLCLQGKDNFLMCSMGLIVSFFCEDFKDQGQLQHLYGSRLQINFLVLAKIQKSLLPSNNSRDVIEE